jgi:hypothetical protein
MKPMNFPRRKEKRRVEALARQFRYNSLSQQAKNARMGAKQRRKRRISNG